MAQPPLLSLNDVRLTFGGNPLFTGVSFSLSKGERVALVGRNGAGKSTLMKIISESLEADSGEVWRQPGITYAFVAQEPTAHYTRTPAVRLPARRCCPQSDCGRM